MKGISKFVKVVLLTAGITALIIGSCLLFIPVTFQASAGIELGNDPGLLSEMRGPGALILASGVVMIAGAFVFEITLTAYPFLRALWRVWYSTYAQSCR
jgi:hypothetical protein